MDAGSGRIVYPRDVPPETGETIEVADGVLWIRLPLPMALDHVNVYALDDGDGWTLVDTGFASRKTHDIWESLLTGPLAGRPVRRVLVTHHHPDHIGLAGWFQSKQGVELVTSRTAWLFSRMLQLDEQDRPRPETLAFWQRAGMHADLLEERMNERPFNFADVVWPMPLGFTRLKDGDRFDAGGRGWRVRTGNGHAPEHLTLWSDEDDLVIGGDQLLPSISPNLGVYATEPEADPVAEWIESCQHLSAFATDTQLVLPGHKLPFTGLPHRMWQLEENHHGALERLLDHLETPRSAAECFQPLFMRKIGTGEYGLALVEAIAHCLHLWHQGKVERTENDEGAWLWRTRNSTAT